VKVLFVVFLLSLSTSSVTGNTKMLPERVQKAAQDRIAAGTYQTLVFGVVDDGKSEVTRDEPGFVTLVADTQQEIVLPAASLDEYLGTYKLRDKFLLKIFRTNNELFAQATGQGPIAIFPSAQHEFFAKAVKASISFTRNPDGAVSGLVLHQNGDHAAPKLSASEIPPERKEIALDAAASADYVGKYQFDFGAALTVVLTGDHLEAQLTGQSAFPIFASSKDEFFYKVVDAQLTFERDGGAKVVAVVLHQNGRDMRAPRISAQR
jgi:D-alanyl-D-alanine-carboxypeptidase/D-alanyl-D-alanine-endopeptidase